MRNDFTVYLAGPITGCTYGDCTDWRGWVIDNLPQGIVGLSPMRHKEYLLERTSGADLGHVADQYPDFVLSSQRGIFARDHWDCKRCDALLVNMQDAERVSIGTVMEIAWAHAYGKPIVLIMEDGSIHDHSMLREACPFRVKDLDEAVEVLSALFVPKGH